MKHSIPWNSFVWTEFSFQTGKDSIPYRNEVAVELNPLQILNWIADRNTVQVFPNAYIAYRILVTITIANCGSERSFFLRGLKTCIDLLC